MLAASRDSRTVGDDGDDTAAIALCALRNLNRAVAVVSTDGRVLFENSMFTDLFAGEAWPPQLLDGIGRGADGIDGTNPRQIGRRDGRTFSIETMRLPPGLLV